MASIRVTAVMLCGCLVSLVPVGRAAERLVWFGTYTNPQSKSEGIYVSRFDDEAGTPAGFIQHSFSRTGEPGIHPKRQEKPHAHSVDISPDGRFAFVCDLGLDEVLMHALDRDRATLAPHAAAKVKAGAGPRHFALHPDGRHAWCVNDSTSP